MAAGIAHGTDCNRTMQRQKKVINLKFCAVLRCAVLCCT